MQHFAHPKEVVILENKKKVHKIILKNHKVKLQELTDNLNVSKEHVGFILYEHLSMIKLFLKWGVACANRPKVTS